MRIRAFGRPIGKMGDLKNLKRNSLLRYWHTSWVDYNILGYALLRGRQATGRQQIFMCEKLEFGL